VLGALALLLAQADGGQPAAAAPAAAAPAAEAPAAEAPAKVEAKPAEIVEYTLTVRDGSFRVRVTLRPGEPQPHKPLEILLDVARATDSIDATYGDRVPLRDAKMQLSITGPGARERRRVWPMADVGVYGAHWTPAAKGLWTVAVEPIEEKPETPHVSFQIGVGVPMPASSEGQAVRANRVVLAGAPQAPTGPSLREVMKKLGERWLEAGRGGAEADEKAAIEAMRAIVDGLPGTVPAAHAGDGLEYDDIVRGLRADVATLARAPAKERAAQLEQMDEARCLRCHVKFRDGIVKDLLMWPEVKPWQK
jgi:hypothetical protein